MTCVTSALVGWPAGCSKLRNWLCQEGRDKNEWIIKHLFCVAAHSWIMTKNTRAKVNKSKVIGRRRNLSLFLCGMWQRQFAIASFAWRVRPPNLPFTWGIRDPHLTQCVTSVPARWHLNLLNGLSRVHACDRQTDHATEKCIAIGGIALPPEKFM